LIAPTIEQRLVSRLQEQFQAPCVFLTRNGKEFTMKREQILANWQQLKDSAHAEWPKLSAEELEESAGERDKIVDLIQENYECEKHEAERKFEDWCRRAG